MNLSYLLKQSQLHGVNRLSEKRDRLIWTIALLLVCGAASVSMWTALWRFQTNPTFLTRKDNGRYKMPFPAVLICPELDFPDLKMEQFLDEIKIPEHLNRTYLRRVLRQLATYYSPDVEYTVADLNNMFKLLDYNQIGLERAFLRLTSTCEEILLRCRWHGEIRDCMQLFKMKTMQFGVCCVFNGRSLKEDIRIQRLPVKIPKITAFTKAAGFKSGLTVAVNQKGVRTNLRDVDLSYKWAIVNSPQRFVEALTSNGTALSPSTEVWLAYNTYPFEVTEDSRTLSRELRRCELASTPLKHFPVYKRHYCRLECEIRNVQRKCNCTMPTHPTLATTFCKPEALICAKNVVRQSNFKNCKCLPTCDPISDDTAVTYHDLSLEQIPIDNFYKDLNFEEVTIVKVFVNKREVASRTRQSYFTATDLFAQMGGIFNVFIGCSVLSMLEILQLIWYGYRIWLAKKISTTMVKPVSNDKDKIKTKK